MDVANVAIEKLRYHIHQVESHLHVLKQQLTIAEQSTSSNTANQHDLSTSQPNVSPIRPTTPISNGDWGWPLGADEYKRYGRQMIMPEIGLKGNTQVLTSQHCS